MILINKKYYSKEIRGVGKMIQMKEKTREKCLAYEKRVISIINMYLRFSLFYK